MKKNASSKWRTVAVVLGTLVGFQFFLLVSILDSKHPVNPSVVAANNDVLPSELKKSKSINNALAQSEIDTASSSTKTDAGETSNVAQHRPPPEGVAATVMLHAPKWFHRRYTAMILNALANIPPTWSVQVFSNEKWMKKDVLPLHPGLQRLRSHPRIIWTPMPIELTKKRPKEVMKSKWLWESVIAENVLFFSGNGVFCTNSRRTIEDFLDNDYVGVPWGDHDGIGGDASSHSFRKRSDMIRILESFPPDPEEQDYRYFPEYLLKEGTSKLANKTTTVLFGGVTDDPDSAPFVVSGTQDRLDYKARDMLLHVCPELKIIFPSLHEPSCFGAHPNPEKCKATICALQDPLPGSGC